MGKTRTAFVAGTEPDKKEKKSTKELYEEKRLKQAVAKEQVTKVGLKGGERIKTVEAGPVIEESDAEAETSKREYKPKVRGKRYKEALAKVDRNKLYPLKEAIKLVKDTSISKFDGTVEIHLVVKKQGLNTQVELPHSTGSSKKIEVADAKTIEKLKTGKADFDVLLATAEIMPKLVPFAKLLGPKGLMPNPKNGTLIKSKEDAKKFSRNTVNLKTQRKAPVIHTTIGKTSQKQGELKENVEAVIGAIGARQINKAVLTSTMGPGIKLQV